jgi:phosphonate transport system substrate-binding protein
MENDIMTYLENSFKKFGFPLISRGLVLCVLGSGGLVLAQEKSNLGTRKNPIKLAMVPSSESSKILSNMAPVAQCLEAETKLSFEVSVPNSYIVVVESFGSKKVDVAFLNTFGYIVARDKYGVEAILKTSRHGETTYKGAFFVKKDSKIASLNDIAGKKMAYVDPASTSGHILPKKMLMDAKVKVSEEVFAGKHDVALTMLYQNQVDVAAAYYNAPLADQKIRDARERLLKQFPDVGEKLKVLTFTEEVPNDPIAIRAQIPAEMKESIKKAFSTCVQKHTESFKGINNADGLVAVSDSDYDGLRKTIQALGINAAAELEKKK